jgi:hypothetical protein
MSWVIEAFPTLLAAFVGAWFAYRLEARRRAREARERDRDLANLVLFKLFGMWNVLEQYRDEIITLITPALEHPRAWIEMRVSPSTARGVGDVCMNELSFLLQTPHADLALDVLIQAQRFWIAMDLISTRTDLMFSRVRPAIAAAAPASEPSEDEFVRILGVDVVAQLKVLTGGIIKNVDEDLASLRITIAKLREATKKLYPDLDVIRLRFN